MRSIAVRVTGHTRWPKASPQPLMPASVSTRTSRVSIAVRGRPPTIGVSPAMSMGMEVTKVVTAVIFIGTTLL